MEARKEKCDAKQVWKKPLWALLLVFFLSPPGAGALTVVVDLDDTLKVTNVGSLEMIYRGFFSTEAYQPMPELMRAVDGYADRINILTASPVMLRGEVESFLSEQGIPYDTLVMRDFFDYDKIAYKLREMEKMVDESMVLIGDDGGDDQEVYSRFKKLHPEIAIATYIHRVDDREREVLAGEKFYISAFGVAYWEYLAGRMPLQGLQEIASSIVGEEDMVRVIPDFAYCPVLWESPPLEGEEDAAIAALSEQVRNKILGHCQTNR